MKIFDWVRKAYEKFKLKNVAIAAVLISQALKRVVQSELGLLILDMAPIPWVSFIGKALGWISKANAAVPFVVKAIVVSKGILDESSSQDDKMALSVLIDHLKYYNKEELNEFIAFFSLQIINATADDGILDDQEKSEVMEEVYKFLFKTKR